MPDELNKPSGADSTPYAYPIPTGLPDTPVTPEEPPPMPDDPSHTPEESSPADTGSAALGSRIRRVKAFKENPKLAKAERRRNRRRRRRRRIRDLFPRRGDSVGEVIRKIIFLISSLVFLGCMAALGAYGWTLWQAESVYRDVRNIPRSHYVQAATAVSGTPGTATAVATPVAAYDPGRVYTLLPEAETLLKRNPDTVGWITIPDTQVDYPVFRRVNDTPGDEYYLHRNIDQEYSYPGSVFLDFRCQFDNAGGDGHLRYPNTDNLVIYGHDMRDNSMFGSLKYYRTKEDYYEQHPVIYLNSNYETYCYKIIGYFVADANDTTDTRFEYWNKLNFADSRQFYDYVNEVKRRTIRITNVDVSYGDPLLTLSTCSGVFSTARFVVVARQLRPGEGEMDGVAGSTPNPNIKWPKVYSAYDKDAYDPDAPFVPYG